MSRRGSLPTSLAGAVALGVVVAGTLLVQAVTGTDGTAGAPSSGAPRAPVTAEAPARDGAPAADGLPTVSAASLPVEARRTLQLIDEGGPFPYDRDGLVFGNREGLLPRQERGCYREYTVRTPGESDRGARRIVTSCAGPRYWTADHYESFARITGARL